MPPPPTPDNVIPEPAWNRVKGNLQLLYKFFSQAIEILMTNHSDSVLDETSMIADSDEGDDCAYVIGNNARFSEYFLSFRSYKLFRNCL